ncbi:hypothetical protein ACQP2E_04835 [Actinoplanes sp. CA-015351]|uniref:hypothetical protein n=1 Tax=Actinoplanes sp. CA-015351 TaxID=3239897 RepID=UPI003D998128
MQIAPKIHTQLATRDPQLATRDPQLTACGTRPAARGLRHAACGTRPAARDTGGLGRVAGSDRIWRLLAGTTAVTEVPQLDLSD